MIELTFFADASRARVDVERCSKGINGNPFEYGGQGRVYRCGIQHQGRPLDIALKVMPDSIAGTAEVFRRLKGVRESLVSVGGLSDAAYTGIIHRGVPIAQGSATPDVFGFDAEQTHALYILAFHFVDGPLLVEYLRGEEPLSPKRLNAARQLLDILIFLQNHGVVHSDLYPDNFIVDSQGKVFAIDLEGAGIKTRSGNWDFKPTVAGKPWLWPLPPEVDGGGPTFESDIWVGAYLIFETLTGFKPLAFMQRMDKEALEDLHQAAAQSFPCWPPQITQPFRFANPKYSIEEMKRFMDYYFANTYFGGLLFATYVAGYAVPSVRPKFSIFKSALANVLRGGN